MNRIWSFLLFINCLNLIILFILLEVFLKNDREEIFKEAILESIENRQQSEENANEEMEQTRTKKIELTVFSGKKELFVHINGNKVRFLKSA